MTDKQPPAPDGYAWAYTNEEGRNCKYCAFRELDNECWRVNCWKDAHEHITKGTDKVEPYLVRI